MSRPTALWALVVGLAVAQDVTYYNGDHAAGPWSVGVLDYGHPKIRVGAVRVWVAGPWAPDADLVFEGVGSRKNYTIGGAAARAAEGDVLGNPAFDLLGLKPSEVVAWRAVVRRGDGSRAATPFYTETGPLPGYFPAVAASGEASGYVLTSAFPAVQNGAADKWSGAVVLDRDGDVVWALDCGSLFDYTPYYGLMNLRCGVTGTQTALGDFSFEDRSRDSLLVLWGVEGDMTKITTGFTGIAEINARGSIRRLYVATRDVPDWARGQLPWSNVPGEVVYVDTAGFNHQVTPLDADTLVSLGFETKRNVTCPGWPGAVDQVHGNELIVFDRDTGAVARRFSTWDAFDVCATATYATLARNPDWTHLNAFDATLVGSAQPRRAAGPCRNGATGQHNVRVVGAGTPVVLGRRGFGRLRQRRPPGPGLDVPSRLVVWALPGDPRRRPAAFAYGDGSYSPFLGGAQPLLGPGGVAGYLADFGAVTDPPAPFDGRANWARDSATRASSKSAATFSATFGGRDAAGSCGAANARSWNSRRSASPSPGLHVT
ncbi:hypothetical protein JL720_13663 [Aureococcus anophagefferens]|nr:hypothetical protein JL720_13663 [Aureococcus anophagefferens]